MECRGVWLRPARGRRARRLASALALLLAAGCARSGVGELDFDAATHGAGADGRDGPGQGGQGDGAPDGSSVTPGDGGPGGDVIPDDDAGPGAGDSGPARTDAGAPDASTGGCGVDELDCGSGCVNVKSSPSSCGGCDVSCPGTGATCSDGQCNLSGCSWASYGGHDYFLCGGTQLRSFAAARSFCRQLGLDLVIVDDEGEQSWLAGQGTVTGGWLGFTDLDGEGTWRRIDTVEGDTDGDVVWSGGPESSGGMAENGAYVVWSGTEPNDSNGNEDCAYQIGASWWDGVCSESKVFTCETR